MAPLEQLREPRLLLGGRVHKWWPHGTDWRWETTWGWDYPVMAMTAARVWRPADALAMLFHESPRNTWLANGHLRQTDTIPVYLPANGALLAAIALLAGGWDGSPSPAWGPGWSVAHEGLVRMP